MKETSDKTGQQDPYSYREAFGYSKKFPAYTFSKPYRKKAVPAYPSITDELKSDLQILKESLEMKDNFLKDLRKSRDSLITKLNVKDIHIEEFEKRVKRYQEFFYKEKEKQELKETIKKAMAKNVYGGNVYYENIYGENKYGENKYNVQKSSDRKNYA